ncbi:hypothetical protein HFP05_01805 [Rhodanobacter denitrificans]|nr:hypothetical protein [Rhodanobacter denitrificans]
MLSITTVTAFVDWNSQIHVLQLADYKDQEWFLPTMFERLFRRIVNALRKSIGNDRFKIELRLYYGWYKGFEEQLSRKSIRSFILGSEFARITQSQYAFVSDVSYGDTLLSARAERRHKRTGIHLPNTLRSGASANKPPYEKMVDTALGADLLTWAAQFKLEGVAVCDSQVALILGEDDDLWPPVLAAEQMWLKWGGLALVVQDDLPSADMPNTNGLVAER